MVERKRGHVVAIASFAGKVTFPGAVTYCATKFGVTGFMDALFDELCLFEQDFIKTTTVYPTFINTRKELGEFLDKSGGIPRFDPNYAAHMIVKGIVRNQRHIYIPRLTRTVLALKYEVHRKRARRIN
jgi:all-trans-retinol dehydrogenase (NAD+)